MTTRCQFHQYFTSNFFVLLLCAYNLGLWFFGKRILAQKQAAHKMLVKLSPDAVPLVWWVSSGWVPWHPWHKRSSLFLSYRWREKKSFATSNPGVDRRRLCPLLVSAQYSQPHSWYSWHLSGLILSTWKYQGILKGEVSLYCWPPVWLVWNQLYENWQFLLLFAKQTNPNLSNRRSTVQWYLPL